MTSASDPVEIGAFSSYCSLQPPGYGHLLREGQGGEDEPTYAFIIHERTSGTLAGVIPLLERPDVGYFRSLLQTFGFSPEEATDLAEAFHLPQIGRLENRLYSP